MSATNADGNSFYDDINRACERFEAELQSGGEPKIELFVAQVPEGARSELTRELLKLEIYYRRERGDTIGPDDYRSRFPDFASPIDSLPGIAPVPKSERTPTSSVFNVATGPYEGGSIPKGSPSRKSDHAETAFRSSKRFGDYELIKRLGKGGMGIVYLARQRNPDRMVALKLIRLDRLELLTGEKRQQWLDRFRTEGQATARISDDRVVTVYEVGSHGGRPFYSMRYVEGHTLADVVKAGPLPNRRVAALMEQIARAVQAIHDQGVLHRDLKPHNILLDARGRPYVTDFGLAKWLGAAEGITNTGELLGSPEYMSPEQAQDAAHVTETTDVYGLGATLYALLTGRPPFEGNTVADILHQVKYRQPTSPRRLNRSVMRDLETITLKCLEKEPSGRFCSATEVADELQCFLENRPIRTRPISFPGQFWRWCRRNPAIAALSAAAMILMAVACAVYLVYRSAAESKELAEGKVDDLTQQTQKAEGEKKEQEEVARQERDRVRSHRYPVEMRQAYQAWEADDLDRVRELLNRYQPRPDWADPRGWEWYFLQGLSRRLLFSTRDSVLLWSPDGRQAATQNSSDGRVTVWDTTIWRKLCTLSDPLRFPLWDPRSNSQWIGTPQPEQSVDLWWDPLSNGRSIWSPDGRWLIGHSNDHVAKVWNAVTGEETLNLGKSQIGWAWTWSPDNRRLAASPHTPVSATLRTWPDNQLAASDRSKSTIRIFDTTSWKEGPSPAGRLGPWDAPWSPDGKWLLAATSDDSFHQIEAATGKPVAQIKEKEGGLLSWRFVLWRPDSRQLAIVQIVPSDPNKRTVKIGVMNVSTWKEAFAVRRSLDDVGPRLEWSPDCLRLAITGPGGIITVLDTSTWKETLTLQGHTDSVLAMAWSSDSRRLASISGDGTARAWNAANGIEVCRLHGIALPHLAQPILGWSDGNQRLTVSTHAGYRIWDAASGKEHIVASARAGSSSQGSGGGENTLQRAVWVQDIFSGVRGFAPQSVAGPNWSPDGRRIALSGASIGGEAITRIWDTTQQRNNAVCFPLASPGRSTKCFKLSPDNRSIAGVLHDSRLEVWDALKKEKILTLAEPPTDSSPNSIAWSPDGRRFAAVYYTAVKIWEVATAKLLFSESKEGRPISRIVWSPSGQRLALVGMDNVVTCWDAASGKEAPECRVQTASWQFPVAWSPDGQRLATTTPRRGIKIWDMSKGEETLVLADSSRFNSLWIEWSRDGHKLYTWDGSTFRAWDATNGTLAFTVAGPIGSKPPQLSPDNRWLGAITQKGDGYVVDCASGKEVFKLDWNHPGGIYRLSWSPDSRCVACSGFDKFKAWDVRDGKEVFAFSTDSTKPVHNFAWSPDAKRLTTQTNGFSRL
jgi:serine/threonine protein kinase/WD40 repeat protein